MPVPATLARFARRIATDVRGDRPPTLTDELIDYIDQHPRDLNHSLDGLLDQLRRDSEKAEPLVIAYLTLMSMQLESLRYRIDEEHASARQVVDDFQRRLVALARSGDLPDTALAAVAGVLHEAKIPPSADLIDVNQELLDDAELDIDAGTDIHAILHTIAEQHGDDVYAIRESMGESFHAMPSQLRAVVADAMAESPSAVIRDAGALGVLDPDQEVRRKAALSLYRSAQAITPTTLRRLIAIRGWWPEADRHLIDQAVRAARAHGVDCAAWRPAGASDIRASAIDGSGAQGFLIVTPAARRQRLSSVMARHGTGILDAWSGEPETRKRISATIAQAEEAALTLAVSSDYLDREICRQLSCGIRGGTVPPVGLIQVAETIAATEWRPRPRDYEEVLDQLCAELPDALKAPGPIEEIIESSDLWGSIDSVSGSWFEEGREVQEQLAEFDDDLDQDLLLRVLDEIVEPRKAKWTERFVWTALLFKEASADRALPWPQFTVLARELADGRSAAEIPLMANIAFTTILAHDARDDA